MPANEINDGAFQHTAESRDRFWNSVGNVESDLLTHLISPGLMGGPHWPTTRQAYRVVRRGASVIIATDGLADPFDDGTPENGFAMELFIETSDIRSEHARQQGDISALSGSWAFEIVSHVAGTVAGAGGIMQQLEQYGVLSMELPGVSQSRSIKDQLPAPYVTADDSLGILIGMPVDGFPAVIDDMPFSPVHLVPVTVITAAELDVLRNGGASARKALAEQLADRGDHHRTVIR